MGGFQIMSEVILWPGHNVFCAKRLDFDLISFSSQKTNHSVWILFYFFLKRPAGFPIFLYYFHIFLHFGTIRTFLFCDYRTSSTAFNHMHIMSSFDLFVENRISFIWPVMYIITCSIQMYISCNSKSLSSLILIWFYLYGFAKANLIKSHCCSPS